MPGPQPARILVADDEPAILNLIETILSLEGHKIVACPDGATALARALKGGYDLLLIDYHMPGLTGFETLKKLRAAKQTPPVILMSGNLPDEIARKCDEFEGLQLLPKPFSLATLREALTARWIREGRRAARWTLRRHTRRGPSTRASPAAGQGRPVSCPATEECGREPG